MRVYPPEIQKILDDFEPYIQRREYELIEQMPELKEKLEILRKWAFEQGQAL